MSRKRGKYQIFGIMVVFQVILLVTSPNVKAPGNYSLSIQPEPPVVNINQSNDPVVMACTISFEGVSALPSTAYVHASCDLGEVTLTQSQFVFHYPNTIPFEAIIYIYPEIENNTQGEFVLSGYYQDGGIQGNLNPVMQNIYILNYDPNWTAENITTKIKEPGFPLDPLYLFALPSLLLFFGIYKIIINPRLIKNAKRFE